MNPEIRELKDNDVGEVISLFNTMFKEAYYGYPMSKEKFLQRLNNSDFYKASLVLDYKGKAGGFILANTAKKESKWYSSDKGFISLIMISPDLRGRGFGKALLNDALNFLKKKEVREIEISFNPLTFWPGIDSCWVEALVFFEQMRFRESGASSSMVASLETFKIPEKILNKENELRKEKIMFRRYLKEDREPLLNFIKQNFSYEWHEEVRSKIEKVKGGFTGYGLNTDTLYDPESVLVVLKQEEIIGFSMFSKNFERNNLGHFGSTGIQRNLQGKGIGTVLLFKTLEAMKNKGIVKADLWTEYGQYQSRHYYSKAGFRTVKKWIRMSKKLT